MKHRAIIFEDNEPLRRSLWYFFDQRGYEVYTFPEPGLCPLHIVQACPCPSDTNCADVILSDVNMLGANGIDFIEKLIAKGCKQRNFALMSGNFTPTDLARAAKIGCLLFSKPLNMHAVTMWLETVEQSTRSERVLYDWVAAD